MSILTIVPLEALSALTGLVAAVAASLFSRSGPKRSDLLAERLAKASEWKRFEESRLRSILADRSIEKSEWNEILETVERALREVETVQGVAEVEHDYLSRSSRAKMVIVSDMLHEKAKSIAA